MKIQITNTRYKYDNYVLESVFVMFSAESDNVTVRSAEFTLSAEEYRGNESPERLEAIAKERLMTDDGTYQD